MNIERERFEELVARAVEKLPEEFLGRLENVDIVVEDLPSREQLGRSEVGRGMTLLGLYEGIPLTHRSSQYGLVPPDKITIFQKPIEYRCCSENDIVSEIQKVVQHEIAHHFGIGDDRLKEIENGEE
jgi:predicted Zn-dependent protease with MMP-like domain